MPRRQLPSVIRGASADLRWIEAAAADGRPKLASFDVVAYTGVSMDIAGFDHPVVVDIAGFRTPPKPRPGLRDHLRHRIVGHTTEVRVEGAGQGATIRVAGVVSGTGSDAREVRENASNGYPWQASCGWSVHSLEFVRRGSTASANGRTFDGPCYIARATSLKELSFVALGADDDTSARIAASERDTMAKKKKDGTAKAAGRAAIRRPKKVAAGAAADDEDETEPEDVEAEDTGTELEADDTERDDDIEAESDDADIEAEDGAEDDDAGDGSDGQREANASDPVRKLRADAASELERIARIRKLCKGRDDIAARALRGDWSLDKVRLELVRAERPNVSPFMGAGREPLTPRVLEAAACLTAGISEKRLLADFGERTMDAASKLRHIGLREICAGCARIEGKSVPAVFGDGVATMQASFTTMSLPTLLDGMLNRTLLEAYETQDVQALKVCKVGSVKDFRKVTRVRLHGTGAWEKVGPDGEIKSGKLAEQTFEVEAETMGQVITLTRKDIINDDLGAWLDLPRQLGIGAAAAQDDEFFRLLLGNAGSFFHANNSNLLSGAATAFGVDSLSAAHAAFRKLKAGPGSAAKDKRPINIVPKILLVPIELEIDAKVLLGSAQLMLGGSATTERVPVDNPHRNRYEVVSAPHLSDAFYTGSSAKAFYLFPDPRGSVAAFEVVYLNGRQAPTVERGMTAPNTLGLSWQAYIDFKFNQQDPKGALKVKGEA